MVCTYVYLFIFFVNPSPPNNTQPKTLHTIWGSTTTEKSSVKFNALGINTINRSHESFAVPWATCRLVSELQCPHAETWREWTTLELSRTNPKCNEKSNGIWIFQDQQTFNQNKHTPTKTLITWRLAWLILVLPYITTTTTTTSTSKHNIRNIYSLHLIHHTYEEADRISISHYYYTWHKYIIIILRVWEIPYIRDIRDYQQSYRMAIHNLMMSIAP